MLVKQQHNIKLFLSKALIADFVIANIIADLTGANDVASKTKAEVVVAYPSSFQIT